VTREALHDAFDAFRRERDELLAKDDPSMAQYLERRLAEHVESASARAMAAVWSSDDVPLEELHRDASALARGFAAGGAEGADVRAARPDVEGALVRALLSVLAARMRAHAEAVRAREEGADGGGRARELAAWLSRFAPPARQVE